MNNDLLAAALAFASDGLPVFPCESRGKPPMVEGGFKAATVNTEQIRKWWSVRRLGNIGIPTGAVSGFVVRDIDPGGDASLASLAGQHGSLPETRTVKTGRGRQLWFKYPGVPVRCSACVLGRGLDFRGDGGYVVAPPSIHPNGQRYAFLNNCELAEMPAWLIRLTVQPKAAANPTHTANGNRTERIREGERNVSLASIAGTMRGRGLSEAAIRAALLDYNSRQCEPPLPEAEVANIAASVAKYPAGSASSPSGTQPKGFSLVTLGELLARPESPVDWLWKDHLAAGTVSGVFSKPKVGKSTLARNLCLAVARGADFLGLPVKKGLCIYLALEERAEDVTADFRAMGATGDEQILIHADAIPATGILALIGLVQERKPVLVVIDPLFRMVHIRDEKAYAETYAALGPLIDVARSVGTHILVTHHMGKGMKKDLVDSPLGSTGIGAACSSLVVLKRTETYCTIQSVQRMGHAMQETVLAFDPDARRLSVGGTRFEADRGECEAEILEFLSAADGPLTQAQIRAGVEGQTQIIRAALTALAESGRVEKCGDGTRGKPFTYRFPNNGSQYIQGTSKPESEKAARLCMDAGAILVPEDFQKTILVPEGKPASEQEISGRPEAVENVAERSTCTPHSEGKGAGTPKPLEVDKQWRF